MCSQQFINSAFPTFEIKGQQIDCYLIKLISLLIVQLPLGTGDNLSIDIFIYISYLLSCIKIPNYLTPKKFVDC